MSTFQRAQPKNLALKILAFGPEGTGKTRAMLSFPQLAVIDTETGTDLFARKYAFDVKHTKAITEVIAAAKDAMRGDYATIGIDSMTPIYNVLQYAAEGAQRDGSLSAKQWGTIKKSCGKLIDALMVQAKQHVFCTAWTKEKYAKPGAIVNGKTVGAQELVSLGEIADFDKKLGHAFDFVFRFDNQNGYVARVVKARGDIWPAGKELRFDNASFYDVLIAALRAEGVEIGSDARAMQSDVEAAKGDEHLFETAVPTVGELSELHTAAAEAGGDVGASLGSFVMRLYPDFAPGSRLKPEQAVKVRAALKQIAQVPAA